MLNGQLIGVHPEDAALTTTAITFDLPASLLRSKDNVIAVLVDYHGHDETSTAQGVENPRRILGAYLLPGGTLTTTGFKLWKIQRNTGGSKMLIPSLGPWMKVGATVNAASMHRREHSTALARWMAS